MGKDIRLVASQLLIAYYSRVTPTGTLDEFREDIIWNYEYFLTKLKKKNEREVSDE